MILKETLRQVIKSQRKDLKSFDYGTEREELRAIKFNIPYALILSGIRRCGKSTLLNQLLKKLPNFYYLNFEDTRLNSFQIEDFEKLDEIFKEDYGKSEYYLFDEIQNINGWEIFVRSRLDKKKKFIITGSNASLLSKELGTRLTGRHINIELFPFSFTESLSMAKVKADVNSFSEYLKSGGFPEYLKYKKQEILRELLINIIQRDIVVRYKLRDSKTAISLVLYLLTNTGKEFSYNKLKKIFDLGSINTAIAFVSYFEDSYLLFTVPKFDYSLKKQIVNAKKVYSIDNGLSNANSTSFSSDLGRMLENSVFLHLRRRHKNIFYFREKGECDFLVSEQNKIKIAIQVSYKLDEENKEREIDGLLEAIKKFNLREGLILTFNQEDKFEIDGKYIIIKPVWKWMLEH
ncbi:MAG: ATP-binding protein [Candidatus Marsarchaeota archaeon]|nr:ATP-binding protein [Candidatus Marsarchaeota archaeon]MCL5094640.1 ATP-binding protein [Candidatus Marsarchaeota archaeon]